MQKAALVVVLAIVVLSCCVAGWMGPNASAAAPAAAKYLGPASIAATPNGAQLVVACEDAKQVLLVDVAKGQVVAKADLPTVPTGLALDREGKRVYVTCADAPRSVVAVLELPSLKVVQTIAAGHTAIGPAVSPDGKRLYVCNRYQNDVSVIELPSGKELARVPMIREPYGAVVTPDGKAVYVINHLPLDRCDGYDVAAQVGVIDTATNKASFIRLLNGSTGLRNLAISPDGKYVLVPHILARYQMPTTQLERGWMNTNAVSIISTADKKLVNAILLDDVDLGAAVPWGVGFTADSQTVAIAHAGTHEVSVINLPGVFEKLAKIPADQQAAAAAGKKDERAIYASTTLADVPNDLAFLVDLRRRVAVPGKGPRGLAVAGGKAYASQYYSDSLAVVDLAAQPQKVGEIALGPQPKWTVARHGDQLFNDATICFQHWQSCASCHPDARVDGLNWDLMNDGLGNPKNNKTMLLALATPPSMWTGIRPTGESAVRSGMTHILFTVRPEEEAVAMDEYIKTLQAVPSPHLVNGGLSPAAKRGKELFFKEEIGCARCHPAPLYTDLKMHDVGSYNKYDRRTTFDTPSLVECWRTAPFMHDGHYLSVKELLTEGQHGFKGGEHPKLTDEQLNDIAEFVLSL